MFRSVCSLAVLLVSAGCSDVRLFGSYPGQTIRTEAQSRLLVSRPVTERDPERLSRAISAGYEPPDRILCAEPSPDAISAQARSGGAQGRVPVSVGTPAPVGNVEAAFAYATAQQVAYIGYRTATIQALRDLAFQACLGYSNGIFSRDDYRRVLASTDNVLLGMHAIDGLTGAMPAPPIVVGVGSQAGAQPGQPVNASATPATINVLTQAGTSPSRGATDAGAGGNTGGRNPDRPETPPDQRSEHLATVADAIVRIVCHTVLNRELDYGRLSVEPVTGRTIPSVVNVPTWGCPDPGRSANPSASAPVAGGGVRRSNR